MCKCTHLIGMPTKKQENPKRLQPKGDVLRRLYLHSGNVCAFPGCDRVMINRDGVMIGKICHIEAAEPGGKRFNATMSNEQRRGFENLILLCGDHHTVIDSHAVKYPVAKLHQMKANHEAKFSAIANTLKRRFTAQYEDATDLIETKLPQTLSSLMAYMSEAFGEGDVPDVIAQLTSYVERLEKAPEQHREFMLAVFRRAEKLDTDHSGQPAVDVDDLKTALNVSGHRIKKEITALERYNLGWLYAPEPGVYKVVLSNPGDFVYLWDIAGFCREKQIDMRKFFIDVDFSLLD